MVYKLKKRNNYSRRSHQFTPGNVNSLTQTYSFSLSHFSFSYDTALYFLSLLGFLGTDCKHQDPKIRQRK